jgi:FeS assembly SUF system protein
MDTPEQQPRRFSLPVLPSSGKVEQLRAETQVPVAPSSPLPNHTPPSRPPDAPPAMAMSHVNRLAAEGREPQGLEAKVVEALRSVYDPEIPVNIYDLGLIYAIEMSPGNEVRLIMTLTAPGCPVAGSLPAEVETQVENIPEVKGARVDLVWEPSWAPAMMSEVARLELGM